MKKFSKLNFNGFMRLITELFLFLFLLILPFQIRFIVFSPHVYSAGNFNEFNAVFVYLADLLVTCAFLTFFIGKLFAKSENSKVNDDKRTLLIPFLGLILIVLSIIVSKEHPLSILFLLRGLEAIFLVFLIVNDAINLKKAAFIFGISVLIQFVIGLFQIILQHSIGLRVIGEPIINSVIPGVAKIDLEGGKFLRAYGTFLHPNILSVYFLFFYLGVLNLMKKSLFKYLLLIGSLIGIVITFSRMTIVVSIIASLLYVLCINESKIKYYIAGVFVLLISFFSGFNNIIKTRFTEIISDGSVLERINLLKYSFKIISQYPLGIGIGNFTKYLSFVSEDKLQPWDYQPVHNVFALLVSEWGLIFGLLFVSFNFVFFYKLLKIAYSKNMVVEEYEKSLLAFLKRVSFFLILAFISFFILSLNDHYFYTSCQGNYLIAIFYGLGFWVFSNAKLLPLKKS